MDAPRSMRRELAEELLRGHGVSAAPLTDFT